METKQKIVLTLPADLESRKHDFQLALEEELMSGPHGGISIKAFDKYDIEVVVSQSSEKVA